MNWLSEKILSVTRGSLRNPFVMAGLFLLLLAAVYLSPGSEDEG